MCENGYEKEFLLLKASVSKMLSLVHNSITMAVESLESAERKLAEKVLSLDDVIDDANRDIESSIYNIILNYRLSPDDLRYAITMIKFVNNLERIGDLACNIAEVSLTIIEKNYTFSLSNEMKEMFGTVLKMIDDSFKAFASRDVELAILVWKRDDFVDDLERKIRWNIVERLRDNTVEPELAQLCVLIARDLERIGDHSTNLCEEVVYVEKGMEIPDILKGAESYGEDSDSRR